jgi:hypothetical protein
LRDGYELRKNARRGLCAWCNHFVCSLWILTFTLLGDVMKKIDAVLMHLKKKPITSWDAIQLYKATRLADIVFQLKKKGYKILTVMVNNGNSCYAKYFLLKSKK